MNFTEKNSNRRTAFRAARDEDRRGALHARSLRRAVGGAFGTIPEDGLHNTMVFGTTGTPRTKGDKS